MKCTLILLIFLISFQSALALDKHKFVFSTDNPEGSLHVFALEKFSQLIDKYSKGRVSAVIHHRGSKKYPPFEGEEVNVSMILNTKQISPIQGTVVAVGNLSLKVPILDFLMLPYVFPTIESAKKLFGSDLMSVKINNILMEKYKIRVIAWLIGGFRHLTNSKRPVRSLADLKNLVIRTPRNHIMTKTYKAFGAKVRPLSWDRVPKALGNKTIDGQENPYNVIFYSKFWELHQKYLTKNGPFLWVGPIVIRVENYLELADDLKLAFDRAGKEAAQAQWEWIAKRNADFESQLKLKGMQIIAPRNLENWIKASEIVYKNVYEIVGYGDKAQGKKLVEDVLEITR